MMWIRIRVLQFNGNEPLKPKNSRCALRPGNLARQFAQADGARLGRQSDREVRPDRTDVKAVDTEADDDGKARDVGEGIRRRS